MMLFWFGGKLVTRGEKRREYQRAYYVKNREEIKARSRAWHQENKEAAAARSKQYREADKEAAAARCRRYYETNKEAVAARQKRYRTANPHKVVANNHRRRATKLQATPCWDTDVDRHVESLALLRAPDQHIDHVVPLVGKKHNTHHIQLVCGLHTADNLRLLPASENLSKSCREWPDMWDYTSEHMAELESIYASQQPSRMCMKHYA